MDADSAEQAGADQDSADQDGAPQPADAGLSKNLARRRRRRPWRANVVILVAGGAALLGFALWAAGESTRLTTITESPRGTESPTLAPPRGDEVQTFAFVRTGIVYVDPATSEIAWQDRDGNRSAIWEEPPWQSEPDGAGRTRWNEHHDIVGHPEHDVAAWVETDTGADGERRGGIVVVEAHTGEVLARTPPIEGSPESSVVIASVDDKAVYFAVIDPQTGNPDVADLEVRVWRWTSDAQPQPLTPNDQYLNDVSAGVRGAWSEGGMNFLTPDLETLSTVDVPSHHEPSVHPDFGSAMSPDGTYWFGAWGGELVDTRTGGTVVISDEPASQYGWISATELALTTCQPGRTDCSTFVCDVTTAADGFCNPRAPRRQDLEQTEFEVCRDFGLVCRGMPAN
jgi:hypothetical protein